MTTQFDDLVGTFLRSIPDAATITAPAASESELDEILRLVMALDDEQRAEFLVEFNEPWRLLIVCNSAHPNLAAFCGWVSNMDGIILLAGPDGPPPPLVKLFRSADLPKLGTVE